MRTVNEIKERVEQQRKDYIDSVMIQTCGGIHPLQEYVPEFFIEGHQDKATPLTRENIIAQMQDYIDFAFEKAENQRGISAERSIWKFKQWLWVLEDDSIPTDNYCDYGIEILKCITEKYKLGTKEQ